MPVLERPLRPGDRVAILEDDEANRRTTGWVVEEAEFDPVPFQSAPRTVDELLDQVEQRASALICDHRLQKKWSVPYLGAEVVARANRRRIPAVLITSHANSDENVSIRRWRSGIPSLLERGSDAEIVAKALGVAEDEVNGKFSTERKPYTAIVRVQELRYGPEGVVAECVVTAWQPRTTVDVPASMITDALNVSPSALVGLRMVADINIYAPKAGELYFKNFRPSRGVPAEWLQK